MRAKITDKITGVDKLFMTEEDLANTVTSPPPTKETSTSPITSTSTVEDTVTSPLIKATDTCHRMIGYYISHQRDFIKKKAKEYKVTESAVMRVAVEELMKSGKI